jgi:uncharacterized protein with PhoU and TrkA domain
MSSRWSSISDFKNKYVDLIYDSVAYLYEKVRETNVEMRREADYQIDYAKADVFGKEEEIKELEIKISELQKKVIGLKGELHLIINQNNEI